MAVKESRSLERNTRTLSLFQTHSLQKRAIDRNDKSPSTKRHVKLCKPGKFFQPEIALTIEILQMSQPRNAWWADQWNH
jgi:hypothetical protein